MADLKAGTTIGGAGLWNASNLQLAPSGDSITYRGYKVYTEKDKPTPADIGAVNKAGDTITGALVMTYGQPLQLTAQNAGIEIGSTSVVGSPYIDFHTDGTNKDFNIRVSADNVAPGRLNILSNANADMMLNFGTTSILQLNYSGSTDIKTKEGATIIRDHGNGHVTLSASLSGGAVGDLYLGYNVAGTNTRTNNVRLERPMVWQDGAQLVNASGKLVSSSLDISVYDQATSDSRFVNMSGDSMSGVLRPNAGVSFDAKPYYTYDSTSLVTWPADASTSNGVNHLRKVRGYSAGTIFHELVDNRNNEIAWWTGVGPTLKILSFDGLGNLNTNGSITSATGIVNSRRSSGGTAHFWFKDQSDTDIGVIYVPSSDNRMHIRPYNNNFVMVDGPVLQVSGSAWAAVSGHGYAVQYQTTAPLHVEFGTVPGGSDYYPIVRGRGYAQSYGYGTMVELGMLRSGNGWGVGNIVVGSAEGSVPQAIYSFTVTGDFSAPGQIAGNTFRIANNSTIGSATIATDGNINGPAFDNQWLNAWVNGRAQAWAVQEANRARTEAVNQCLTAIRLGGLQETGAGTYYATDCPAGWVMVGINKGQGGSTNNATIAVRSKCIQIYMPNLGGWVNAVDHWGYV